MHLQDVWSENEISSWKQEFKFLLPLTSGFFFFFPWWAYTKRILSAQDRKRDLKIPSIFLLKSSGFERNTFHRIKLFLTLMAPCNCSMFSTVLPDLILDEVSSWPLGGCFAVCSVQASTYSVLAPKKTKKARKENVAAASLRVTDSWFLSPFFFAASGGSNLLNSIIYLRQQRSVSSAWEVAKV